MGAASFLFIVLAFTDLPYLAYHRLGTAAGALEQAPEFIVVLGGAGMPSGDGFMRAHQAAERALEHPLASIVIALPADTSSDEPLYQLDLFRAFLKNSGVAESRVHYLTNGHNTHEQARSFYNRLSSEDRSKAVMVVTSPEHMYRAVRTFQAAGLQQVGGSASFEQPIPPSALKGPEGSDSERSLAWRYNFWSYMHYELLVMREYAAISWYWLRGWI